jgi:hypothetical protein
MFNWFKKNNDYDYIECNSVVYFGRIFEEGGKSESGKFIGWLDVRDFDADQIEYLKDYARKVDNFIDNLRDDHEKELYDLQPNYKIEFSPSDFGSMADKPFIVSVKKNILNKNHKGTGWFQTRVATKAEAEKEAKRLIKLADEENA